MRAHNGDSKYYYRLLILASILYPSWYVPIKHAFPTANDSFAVRGIIGVCMASAALLSHINPIFKKYLEYFFLLFTNLMMMHMTYLAYVNNLNDIYVIAYFTTLFCVAAVLNRSYMLVVFILLCSITLPVFVYFVETDSPKDIFLIGGFTDLLILYVAFAQKIRITLDVRKQQNTLIHSSKMVALGEMAGGLAHEINNPLAVIHGRAGQLKSMAENGTASQEMVLKIADKIEMTSMRIAKIIKSLRTFASDSNQDQFMATSFKAILETTLDLCMERFKIHSIQLDIPEFEDLTFECKAAEIRQVLFNLLTNSYSAIENLNEKWIRVELVKKPESFDIVITDSGPGITNHLREKIFTPFFTTKPIGKGTGLGLAVSLGLIKGHQGLLYVNFESPHTQFIITLPYTQSAVAA